MNDYKEELQSALHAVLAEKGDVLSANDIAKMLKKDHQWRDDEYPGGRERGTPKCIHVPDVTGISLPGKANPVEEWARGNPDQLLVQRLGITPEKAGEVIKKLGKRFEITP